MLPETWWLQQVPVSTIHLRLLARGGGGGLDTSMVKKNQKSKVCAYTRVSSKAGDIQAQRQLVAKATGLSKHQIKSDVALSGNVPVSERKVWQEFAQNR